MPPVPENYAMTAMSLLIICVSAQILIAAGLGAYFLRRHLRQRREKNRGLTPDPASDDKIPPA